jgi:amino acid transporter
MFHRLKRLVLGQDKDPLSKTTKHSMALTAFFAWIGLGADGLSSSCYGPQEAFLALGEHNQLALYLAIATAVTVFIISFAYNQVIQLFPNGGGGYKVATKLLGPNWGLVAGAALLVDYVLTIVISIASGADALFSLFPYGFQAHKLKFEMLVIIFLMILNVRGMKESIKILMPVFIGFVITHLFMIIYGVMRHGDMLPQLVNNAVTESHNLAALKGSFFAIAIFLHAYSIGGGTYTGLEAVSNNVNVLAEPRVRTGKWTMFIMALSLSLTAGGIILLYLLWNVSPQAGMTLNAIAFKSLLYDWKNAGIIITTTLLFEFGLLFVGANTGFLGGPAVLANMAMDNWVPKKFRNLSSRLTTQNGIILFGIAALLLLLMTKGHVYFLVILYSINVFLAFSVSILGLCKYWFCERKTNWRRSLALALLAFIICVGILLVVLISQFFQGGIEAVGLTGLVILCCYMIKRHYNKVGLKLSAADKMFIDDNDEKLAIESENLFDPQKKTAVFFISESKGVGMHTLLWVQRLFPNYFHNFIFVKVGVIDVKSYGAERVFKQVEKNVNDDLAYFEHYCKKRNIPVKTFSEFGIDPVQECNAIAEKITNAVPNCIFFASQLVFKDSNWMIRQLHNDTGFAIQRKLYSNNRQMMIMPMNLS